MAFVAKKNINFFVGDVGSYTCVYIFRAISPPVASGTVFVCRNNTRVLGRRLVSGKRERKHQKSSHDKDDFIGSAFFWRDVMPRRNAAKRPVAVVVG